MDHEMELKGCFRRIKNCAVELFSTMEEDLEIDDEDSWDLVGRDIRLKATFLYIDLSRVIACCEGEEHKKALNVLANRFFYSMDEVRIPFPLFGIVLGKFRLQLVYIPIDT